ncbi:MAG: PASTA domain-containing protein [Acidobacteria bacterium]|nr:PASTA domain-containing protein [Acidobacteriota bacterium]
MRSGSGNHRKHQTDCGQRAQLTNDQPTGTVLNQFPEPGTRVDPQTEVRLIVAEPLNGADFRVPDLSTPATDTPDTPPPSPPDFDFIPWVVVVITGGAAGIFILRLFRRKPDGKKDETLKPPVTDAIQYRVSSDPGSPE